MSTVILKKDHIKAIQKTKRRHLWIHLVGVVGTMAILTVPYIWKLDRDLIFESYRIAKMEFDGVLAKQKLLLVLRARGLTLGQGLDIADVILGQREIPPNIVMAIMEVESNFNPDAVSAHGARGLMQPMPLTAKTYAGDPSKHIHDPVVNIKASLGYLKDLKDTCGDWPRTLRSYNGGPKNRENKALNGYVERVMAKAEVFKKQMER